MNATLILTATLILNATLILTATPTTGTNEERVNVRNASDETGAGVAKATRLCHWHGYARGDDDDAMASGVRCDALGRRRCLRSCRRAACAMPPARTAPLARSVVLRR